MKELIEYTRGLFEKGMPLSKMVEGKLSVDLAMFSKGGMAVLDAIESIGYDTLNRRPEVSKGKQVRLLGRALVAHVWGAAPTPITQAPSHHSAADAKEAEMLSVPESYRSNATGMAREAHSSFYPAFFCCRSRSAMALWRCMRSCA